MTERAEGDGVQQNLKSATPNPSFGVEPCNRAGYEAVQQDVNDGRQIALLPEDTDPFFGDRPAPTTLMEGIAEAWWIIEQAIEQHGPIRSTFLLLSGGNDSMVLLDACQRAADEIVHINTGIGIPETNEFVRWVVDAMGRPLVEMHPPESYEECVMGRWLGLPGPGAHRFTFTMLKERCVEQLIRERRTKRGQRFILLTGARRDESDRRMGTAEAVRREGGQVWVNPLLRWSNDLMRLYRGVHDLPVNEVTKHLHMSGECLCGAFAKPGELDEIRFFYPEFGERIDKLEAEVAAAGLPYTKWGVKRPSTKREKVSPLCSGCEWRMDSLFDENVA